MRSSLSDELKGFAGGFEAVGAEDAGLPEDVAEEVVVLGAQESEKWVKNGDGLGSRS